MSFLSKVFGTRRGHTTSSGSGGAMSVARMLEKMDAKFESHRCGTCGVTFMSGSVRLNLFTPTIHDWSLDAGGYCPECEVYCCPTHSRFVAVPDTLKGDAGGGALGPWSIGCGSCGTPLVQNAEGAGLSAAAIRRIADAAIKRASVSPRDYLESLKALDPKTAAARLAGSPHLGRFVEACRLEKSIDFAAVEQERLSLIEVLAKGLSDSDIQALVEHSNALKAGKETNTAYNAYLVNLCRAHRIDIARFAKLKAYMEYVALSDKIDKEKVQEELAALMRAV